MGNIATSGGYYVALAADKIVANSSTLTGSIGVISVMQNFSSLQSILGIERDIIKTGKYMDLYSISKELTEDEIQMLKNFQRKYHGIFKNRVQENRDISDETLNMVAEGQVLTGSQAIDYNLIDDIGTFFDVIDMIKTSLELSDPELLFFRSDNLP